MQKLLESNKPASKQFFIFFPFIFFMIAIYFGIGLVIAQSTSISISKHQLKGISCQDCHIETPPSKTVPENKCLSCHGDLTLLVEKTNKVYPNPHASPHIEPGKIPNCNECHHIHKPSTVSCLQCHPEFKFNVK